MFSKGDRVTVIDAEGQPPNTLGRTGTVHSVSGDGLFVFVAGIDWRITEFAVGERAYRPDQLRKD